MTSRTTTPRRFAVDPRLIIGLGLVVVSVAGVVGIVAGSDETIEVLAARDALSPGDRLDERDLEIRKVRLDDAAALYIAPHEFPDEGLIVTRSVARGELLPASAVGSTDGLRLTSLVLEVGGPLAASIGPGSVVDVWASREQDGGGYGPPGVIVAGATVVRLVESDSMVSSGETTAVEVLVPKSQVARVLETIANDDALSIVPASIPGR